VLSSVQKCKSAYGLCKGANVSGIFGSQTSALGHLVRVIRHGCGYGQNHGLNLHPNLNA